KSRVAASPYPAYVTTGTTLLVFAHRYAGAEQVTVAVNIIKTFHGWPVFVCYTCREDSQLAGITVVPLCHQFVLGMRRVDQRVIFQRPFPAFHAVDFAADRQHRVD